VSGSPEQKDELGTLLGAFRGIWIFKGLGENCRSSIRYGKRVCSNIISIEQESVCGHELHRGSKVISSITKKGKV